MRVITKIPVMKKTIKIDYITWERLLSVKFREETWTDFLERLLEEHIAYRHRLAEIGEDFAEMNPLEYLED